MNRVDVYSQLDFLRTNPDGFRNIRSENAIEILEVFAEEGVSPWHLLRSALLVPSDKRAVLTALMRWFETHSRQREFLEAALRLRDDAWKRMGPDSRLVAPEFRAEDFPLVLRGFAKALLLDEFDPLFGNFDPDAYWLTRVGYWITRNDFPRSWDEIKKASRGFKRMGAQYLPGAEEDSLERETRCYAASNRCLEKLITDLYKIMKAKKFVPPSHELDLELDSDKVSVPNSAKPKSLRWATRAGLDIALRFRVDEESQTFPLNLFPIGAMALKIGERLSARKSKKRAQKARKEASNKNPES